MKWSENAGLVKFDFLGLKTLTVIKKTVNSLKENNININLKDLSLDDPKTFELLCSGETMGVFQLESAGMREVLKQMKPNKFEDIIALVALFRPGPMQSSRRPTIRRKRETAWRKSRRSHARRWTRCATSRGSFNRTPTVTVT